METKHLAFSPFVYLLVQLIVLSGMGWVHSGYHVVENPWGRGDGGEPGRNYISPGVGGMRRLALGGLWEGNREDKRKNLHERNHWVVVLKI